MYVMFIPILHLLLVVQLKESANCRSRHFKDYCDRTSVKQEIR